MDGSLYALVNSLFMQDSPSLKVKLHLFLIGVHASTCKRSKELWCRNLQGPKVCLMEGVSSVQFYYVFWWKEHSTYSNAMSNFSKIINNIELIDPLYLGNFTYGWLEKPQDLLLQLIDFRSMLSWIEDLETSNRRSIQLQCADLIAEGLYFKFMN